MDVHETMCVRHGVTRFSMRKALMADVVRWQMSLLEHIRMKDELENIVVTGFVDDKHGQGELKTEI